MGYGEQVRSIVKRHVDTVSALDKELTELEELAQSFSTLISRNEQINAEIHQCEERIGYLYSQRQELYEDYHNAMFEGDTARVLEIEGERDNIDEETANSENDIDKARNSLSEPDGDAVAEMLRRLDAIEMRPGDNVWSVRRDYSERGIQPAFLDELRTLLDEQRAEVGRRKLAISQAEQWHRYASLVTA